MSEAQIDPAFAHDPDRNQAWTPKMARRRYICQGCGTEREMETNHTGTVWAGRCAGTCREIIHPNTAREVVLPFHGPHRYLGEIE